MLLPAVLGWVPLLVFGPSRQTLDPRFCDKAPNDRTEAIRTTLPSRHATPVHDNKADLGTATSMNDRVQHIGCDVMLATRSSVAAGSACICPRVPGSSILHPTLLFAVETGAVGASTARHSRSSDALLAP